MNTDCPANLVRFTTKLARRLGVTRRTIHRWRKLPGAPKKIDGCWDVWSWIEFIESRRLDRREFTERCWLALKVALLLDERLPERVCRTTERLLLEAVELLCPYDRKARREFQASAPNTGSQAAEMPRLIRIESINPWSLPETR